MASSANVKKDPTGRKLSFFSRYFDIGAKGCNVFNQQLTLLEDHHNHAEKRCPNCVSKHGKCIEGLAEEAVTLCTPKQRELAREASQVARAIRVLQHAWAEKPKDDALNTLVAAKLRQIRKRLQKKYSFLPLKALPSKEAQAVHAILRSKHT